MRRTFLSEERAIELLPMALSLQPGVTPFPWQERLLTSLIKGTLPSAIDLPTGLGKTSVIAIWLLARAAGAKIPLRLVYVVDRRAVVDQASTVAEHLADLVKQTSDLVTALGVDAERGLAVSTLRGQHIDNRRWLDDPSVPAIIVGTVDMIGSRLLFEGYGASRKTRSLHAALLGVDSLLVLDEAHLSPSFEDMVRAVANRQFDGRRVDVVPTRVKLLPLSATQRSSTDVVFSLDDADKRHDEVTRRLGAQKWIKIHEAVEEGNAYANAVASLACQRVRDGASRVVVYLDSRDQAQKAREAFDKQAKDEALEVHTELLVGARRVFERGQVAEWLVDHGFHGEQTEPKRGVLFATSAGEVGVDLDAEHLICDLVAFERMVQRLGRVNRRGKSVSLVDVVPVKKAEKKKGKSGEDEDEGSQSKDADLKLVVTLLTSLDARDDGRRNLSPQALRGLQTSKKEEVAAASTPTPLHPALTRPLVEAWAMTSLREHTARPKVDPWLRGWVDVEPQTTVVWRKHLPVAVDHKPLSHALVRAYFDAAPAELLETLETETSNVTKWIGELKKKTDAVPEKLAKTKSEVLDAKTDAARAKKEGERQALETLPKAEDVVGFLVDDGGDVVIEGGLAGHTLEMLAALDKRDLGGKTLFVDVRLGGLDHGLLNAKEDATEVSDVDGRTSRFTLQPTTAKDESKDWRRVFTTPVDISDEGDIDQYLVIDQLVEKGRPNEEGLSVSKEQALTEHQQWAQEEAKRIGAAVGLSSDDIAMLALAAVHHDDGKAAARWQAAFHAPADKQPLAKVGKWIDQSILGGYRHEVGSLLGLMGRWDVFQEAKSSLALSSLSTERQELAKHLVSSHHGWSRPTLPVEGVESLPPSKLGDVQCEAAERFAALQETWGPWGLAWWEALLRAADGIASRKNDAKGGGS
ncbi:MAG TPA: type I-U CRISPR-associated helicase/endonuclease Cas3 [Chiayiivirga sp.]|nr:type I-U CRISPR-associated helicase/endonuclease Cas3 [Chiayiivirga sp.]